jgi:hypothetical protein
VKEWEGKDMKQFGKNQPTRKGSKPAGTALPRLGGDPLTCTEDQVEAIFSKGESTKPASRKGPGRR